MAGTGSARGGLGWVILVIALAVPGVLFYNWWSHLKTDREKTVAAKARGRVPDGGVFQSSPNVKLVNPMIPTLSTGTAAAQGASAAAVTSTSPAVVVAASAVTIAPSSGTATVAEGQSHSSSTAAVAVALTRDPTMSPFDRIRLTQEEEARRKAAVDLAAMQNAKKHPGKRAAKPQRDPATLVNLQGIVSNPESGFKAIVNDEVLGSGEFVGNTKIKIVKITDLGVTFSYQGKKFSKGVSRD